MDTLEIKTIIAEFEKYSDSDRAEKMSAYMKHHFPFVGIQAPLRRDIGRLFIKKYKDLEIAEIEKLSYQLWDLPEREYQYIALQWLEAVRDKLTPSHVEFLIDLAVKKSWWDSIDWLAPNIIGYVLKRYPDLIPEYIPIWLESDNIWLNRIAILFQLKYKQETDFELLIQIIDFLKGKKEFFVKKAIGWALREYSKTNSKVVISYINKAELQALSEKEGLKYIHKHKL